MPEQPRKRHVLEYLAEYLDSDPLVASVFYDALVRLERDIPARAAALRARALLAGRGRAA